MKVSKEELMHIANLADLNLNEEEQERYLKSLEDILEFSQVITEAKTEGLDETVGINENHNVFRKDEVEKFEDTEALLQNAPEKEKNMFKIPKVIQ